MYCTVLNSTVFYCIVLYLVIKLHFLSEEITVLHSAAAVFASVSLSLTVVGVIAGARVIAGASGLLYCQINPIKLFITPISILLVSYPTLLVVLITLLDL